MTLDELMRKIQASGFLCEEERVAWLARISREGFSETLLDDLLIFLDEKIVEIALVIGLDEGEVCDTHPPIDDQELLDQLMDRSNLILNDATHQADHAQAQILRDDVLKSFPQDMRF